MINDNTTVTISIEVNPYALARVSDSHLAMLWHVAQANPAPHADETAGRVAANVGWEIIRRWLASTPPEMYHHQQDHYRSKHLSRFAIYRDGDWHPDPDKLAKYEAEQAQKATAETAPTGEGGDEGNPPSEHSCTLPPTQRLTCGHCPHQLCEDCDRCPCRCRCTQDGDR
ncbi:hypothetical protein [Streptomyces turgidiscabies]|uniref:hypothetical protein n=1 Tax=Streptomyces turgidiscabies TaxID=85558 RepID=UPI0038F74588